MKTLEQSQDIVLGALQALPRFADQGIVFLSRREGQVLNDIDSGYALHDLACFVYPVVPESINGNLPGPVFDAMQIRVSWFEDYDRREAGKMHADEAAVLTLQTLHHYSIYSDGVHLITAQEEGAAEWSLTKGGLQQWDCYFTCQLSLPNIKRTPRPTITYDADTDRVTIACSDTDAALWYTTDGSFPHPENDAAKLYNEPVTFGGVIVTHEDGVVTHGDPFDPETSTEIRAIAINAAKLPSNLKSITLSEPT